jgi:ferredoxin-NADP reductase
MAGTAVLGRLSWQVATVVELIDETPRVRSIVLEREGWTGHRAGQHVDVRLTAEGGYQAQRSYSIASGPEDSQLVLTVERLEDGEVSPYLVEELRPGDQLELRGPIGGYFVWTESLGGPLLLLAGGSGVVPLRAMLRHHRAVHSDVPVRLLYSARSLDDVIYRDELTQLGMRSEIDVRLTLTRERPEGWRGYASRIDKELVEEVGWAPSEAPLTYVCGPTSFVETAAEALVELGHDASRIRTERFGGTGGSA